MLREKAEHDLTILHERQGHGDRQRLTMCTWSCVLASTWSNSDHTKSRRSLCGMRDVRSGHLEEDDVAREVGAEVAKR